MHHDTGEMRPNQIFILTIYYYFWF